MFSRSKKASASVAVNAGPPPSIVSADMRIVGDLSSQGEIQIDGAVEGDIRAKSLLVGETAEIKGEILAEQIRVHGRIHGQIKARTVHLAHTAHVAGDILHETLSVENGAFIEGHCKRMNERRESPVSGTAAASDAPAVRAAGEGKKLFS